MGSTYRVWQASCQHSEWHHKLWLLMLFTQNQPAFIWHVWEWQVWKCHGNQGKQNHGLTFSDPMTHFIALTSAATEIGHRTLRQHVCGVVSNPWKPGRQQMRCTMYLLLVIIYSLSEKTMQTSHVWFDVTMTPNTYSWLPQNVVEVQ